ncbi:Uncharacterized membrane protein [Noviherbaspirillum humi]|uniref:Uncharacterized membrane protein n=1 Tax=Noviherbaspirillum humi TaxID=1688639 RepID=A0A239LGW6_9BURK|nr:DMT family transporter [Noviherbaspirillum humi]SNT29711.1 Uncharacterized membrane protein [Noviherbaspirillum humi]
MGELFAILSALCFSAGNVAINQGSQGKGADNGAFLSILMTAAIACAIWLAQGGASRLDAVNPAGLLWFAAAGALTIFVGRVFMFASVQHLGAIQASAVKRLGPLFSVTLGVLLLNEPFDGVMAGGMLLIGASFAMLVLQSTRGKPQGPTPATAARPWRDRIANIGFLYGPVSALAYSIGYVARKWGLIHIPDAAFGTMIGSITGAIIFLAAAVFLRSYRQAVHATFTRFNSWLTAAGVLSSVGQVLYFYALSYTTISRVALITSMEAFLTIFLSIAVFRTREKVTAPTLFAAGLGVAGTALIVLH